MSTSTISHVADRLAMKEWVNLTFWKDELTRFDQEVNADLSNSHELLKNIPLAVWGATLLQPEEYFPRAAKFLPIMPSNEVQNNWTGACGTVLLELSFSFVQQVIMHIAELNIHLKDAKVLDFGIGWGRLARLWLKYLPPAQLDGCDAWDISLNHARACNLQNRLVKSDSLLEELPFPNNHFDMIYAFSIFTHLDEIAFTHCLSGIAKMLKQGGWRNIYRTPFKILAITHQFT